MKVQIMTRPTTAPLALIVWFLLTQTGQCFYNPSSGRWLSRDPQQESGGRNLYIAVANDPLGRIDRLGLRDFQWRYPIYEKPHEFPSRDKYGEIDGATWWVAFDPKVHLWQRPGSPCCWGMSFIGNYAQLQVWWVKENEKDKQHEVYHVNNHYYPAYVGFWSEANSYMVPCKSGLAAACFASAIEGELRFAYMSWSLYLAKTWDQEQYGREDPSGETGLEAVTAAAQYAAARLAADLKIFKCWLLNAL